MDNSLFLSIRTRALRDTLAPDRDYYIRKISRWYSKTFLTPLQEVFEIPLEEVLQAYFEEIYDGMEAEALERERQELLETEASRKARLRALDEEQADADEFARIAALEEQEQKRKRKLKEAEVQKKDGDSLLVPGVVPTKRLDVTPGPALAPIRPLGNKALDRDSDLPSPNKPLEIPPDIQMRFVTEDEFEAEIEGFGTMKQPEKGLP